MNSSQFFVQALVRWADQNLKTVTVTMKGDRDRGVIYLQQELDAGLVRLWVQRRADHDTVVFERRFSEDQTATVVADFIARERQRDEDLWLLVEERSDGSLPPILQSS